MALRRLARELAEWQAEEDGSLTAAPVADDNLYVWKCSFAGPAGTPYEGGRFFLDMNIEQDYPHKPPKITLATQVFHPQVNAQGGMCLPILDQANWTSTNKIKDVIFAAQQLLGDPNANSPFNAEAGELLARDRAAFDARAREFTQRYAM